MRIIFFVSLIFSFIFILEILFFSSYGEPSSRLYGIDTNEIMQDWFEENLGIEKSIASVLQASSIRYGTMDGILFSPAKNSLQFYRLLRGYSGVIQYDIAAQSESRKGEFFFPWQQNMVGRLSRNYGNLQYWAWYRWAILVLPAAIWGLFFLINRKINHRFFLLRNCWSGLMIACAVIFLLHLCYFRIHWRNYNNTHRELEVLLKNNLAALDSALTTSEYTGLHPLSFLSKDPDQPELEELRWRPYFPLTKQEKNIHNGKVFISKTPFMPYDYIRINVDFFSYLFYAPTLQVADLSAINQVMSFTALGDGLWLGEYRMFKNAIHRLVWSYFFALILWSLMLVFSVIALIRSGRRNRKERIANKSDHLSLGGP